MNKTSSNIKILISCHKPTAYLSNDILTPIQLGCANAKERFPDMLHDDEGDNISALNPQYCELTAQYWAWKNLDADYYGFCHYRRYFSFSENEFEEDDYGNIIENYPGKYIIDKYGEDEASMRAFIGDSDIVMTKRQDLNAKPYYNKSVVDHYYSAPLLVNKDIDLVKTIIDELTPEYSRSADAVLNGATLSFCNMYIMKKAIFFEYCEWLFKILDEFCKRADMSNYSTEALRTPGHLSERLVNVFLDKYQKDHPDCKIKEAQSIYFKNTAPATTLEPVFKDDAIPVVFAANNNFAPMFATCLQSVIDTSSKDYNYDIILIQSDLSDENKATLLSMIGQHKNFSLRFYDATSLLSDYELTAREHISVETYYRFLIQDAMPSYDKVLYIDCDLIVKHDLAELYRTNLDGFMLAATYDPDFIGQVNGANQATYQYATDTLKLSDPYSYFQAGVILFNEKEMRKAHSLDEWLNFATEPYRYSDQDVLNVHCEGRVKYLDMSWNALSDCNHERIKNVITHAPSRIQKMYQNARQNPKIIHYAGFMKPWHRPTEDFAHDFWLTARKTPYYEELLAVMSDYRTYHEIDALAHAVSPTGKAKRYSKKVYNKIIRPNTPIDKFTRKILKK